MKFSSGQRSYGIDVAVIFALIGTAIDAASLYLPWLVGINSQYVPGRGLTYEIIAEVSGVDLIPLAPYVALLFVPPALTVALLVLSLRPEGILPPRISYKNKSLIILLVSTLCSFATTFLFWSQFPIGSFLNPKPGAYVSRWEFGSAYNLPIYGGLVFALGLASRVLKD